LHYEIDGAVDRLITESRNAHEAIKKLQSELNSIHAHYREELCGDCCHVHVCGIFPSVKYGFECDEHAYAEEIEIELYEVGPEIESPPVVASNQED